MSDSDDITKKNRSERQGCSLGTHKTQHGPNRRRPKQIKFWVTTEEREDIKASAMRLTYGSVGKLARDRILGKAIHSTMRDQAICILQDVGLDIRLLLRNQPEIISKAMKLFLDAIDKFEAFG